jgi:hypothetical protein
MTRLGRPNRPIHPLRERHADPCCLPERAGNSSGKAVGYMGTRKIGHDAETGQFISVEEAGDRKSTAVVESMKTNSK